jgi:hypothetical protein
MFKFLHISPGLKHVMMHVGSEVQDDGDFRSAPVKSHQDPIITNKVSVVVCICNPS